MWTVERWGPLIRHWADLVVVDEPDVDGATVLRPGATTDEVEELEPLSAVRGLADLEHAGAVASLVHAASDSDDEIAVTATHGLLRAAAAGLVDDDLIDAAITGLATRDTTAAVAERWSAQRRSRDEPDPQSGEDA